MDVINNSAKAEVAADKPAERAVTLPVSPPQGLSQDRLNRIVERVRGVLNDLGSAGEDTTRVALAAALKERGQALSNQDLTAALGALQGLKEIEVFERDGERGSRPQHVRLTPGGTPAEPGHA